MNADRDILLDARAHGDDACPPDCHFCTFVRYPKLPLRLDRHLARMLVGAVSAARFERDAARAERDAARVAALREAASILVEAADRVEREVTP